MNLHRLILIPLFSYTLCSCVTVKFGSDPEKPKGQVYSAPDAPFQEIKLAGVDRAWKSSTTGSTLSYFSECSPMILTLEKIRDDLVFSLSEAKVVESKTLEFDNREALSSEIEGKTEGIEMAVSALIYQKNGCRYTLTYSGRKNLMVDKEKLTFEAFKKGFHAP